MPSNERKTVHYGIDELGLPLMQLPDCPSVFIMQDAYTRQFYPDTDNRFVEVSTGKFGNDTDSYSFTKNHGVIDMMTGIVALNYDPSDCPPEERRQFDALVAAEIKRMFTKGSDPKKPR